MTNIINFIRWALPHAKRESIPPYASLPIPIEQCGTEPWHYLYGTVRAKTTKSKIEERWENHYKKTWSRAQYDAATQGFAADDYATDCQGLLDAYMTYELGVPTDNNSNGNYISWCTSKGKIASIPRPYVIGEALFMARANGVMNHVGWVCGFDDSQNPLIIEARGLAYGVVVTRLSERPWTHRGLMTKKFDYAEQGGTISAQNNNESESTTMATIYRVTSPMQSGTAYRAMQEALNAAGYTDNGNNKLTVDGKWGAKSQAAFDKLIGAHGVLSGNDTKHVVTLTVDGTTKYTVEV